MHHQQPELHIYLLADLNLYAIVPQSKIELKNPSHTILHIAVPVDRLNPMDRDSACISIARVINKYLEGISSRTFQGVQSRDFLPAVRQAINDAIPIAA